MRVVREGFNVKEIGSENGRVVGIKGHTQNGVRGNDLSAEFFSPESIG